MRIECALFADEEVTGGLLVVDLDLLGTVKHLIVLFVAHKEVLKQLLIQVFRGTRLPHEEEARVGHCFGRRQELALLLNILAIRDAR